MVSLKFCPRCKERWKARTKGRGQDLYALRGYIPTDSARHVHWKASARSGSLMVREFTREEDCRVLLVLDPHISSASVASGARRKVLSECKRTLRARGHAVRRDRVAFL